MKVERRIPNCIYVSQCNLATDLEGSDLKAGKVGQRASRRAGRCQDRLQSSFSQSTSSGGNKNHENITAMDWLSTMHPRPYSAEQVDPQV